MKRQRIKKINEDGDEVNGCESFYYGWMGSKRLEIKYLAPHFPDAESIQTIVEPFCGSSAVSYAMYRDGFADHRFHLNDTDPNLISTYNWVKSRDMDPLIKELNDAKEIMRDISAKDYAAYINRPGLAPYIIGWRYHGRQPRQRPLPSKIEQYPDFNKYKTYIYNDFIQRDSTIISQRDWLDIMEQYRDDSGAFIFLDPPYIASCNSMYQDIDQSLEKMYETIFNYLTTSKAKIMLVINDRLLNRLLFKDMIRGRYSKRYALTGREDAHLIITNY